MKTKISDYFPEYYANSGKTDLYTFESGNFFCFPTEECVGVIFTKFGQLVYMNSIPSCDGEEDLQMAQHKFFVSDVESLIELLKRIISLDVNDEEYRLKNNEFGDIIIKREENEKECRYSIEFISDFIKKSNYDVITEIKKRGCIWINDLDREEIIKFSKTLENLLCEEDILVNNQLYVFVKGEYPYLLEMQELEKKYKELEESNDFMDEYEDSIDRAIEKLNKDDNTSYDISDLPL